MKDRARLYAYYGGKHRLIIEIMKCLPLGKFKFYLELFFGSGATFFALDEERYEKRIADEGDSIPESRCARYHLVDCQTCEEGADDRLEAAKLRQKRRHEHDGKHQNEVRALLVLESAEEQLQHPREQLENRQEQHCAGQQHAQGEPPAHMPGTMP